ncbi:TolC family protein [Blastopirellula sp. JC732]|uniref:TolC family protein n=1 Tax=Blastopirellula sediminis TaxID=2894196 RepID=A0A9X1SHW3_9BACT|nr:TolC family protein [Blastopirellula sediminis]MCC9606134.1 TolC family protein [Blastopirellula sediminis]MCC9630567.1 TolC family protein [Blastopirellula sediminis]
MNFKQRASLQCIVAGAVACVLLSAFSGCSIPKLCCAQKGAPLPYEFNGETTSESSAQIGIEEFFDDRVLTQLMAQGLVANQELKIRNQEIRMASNEIMARRGAILPFVTVGARGGMERTSKFTPLGAAEEQLTYPVGGKFPDPLPNVGLTANLFWRIDIWRELRNARDAAMQRYVEAVEVRNYFVTQLVAEIATSYYELAALDKRLQYLNQTIAIQKQSLDVAQAQKDAGRGTELGVQRFLAEVRKNESQLLIVKQEIIETENKINFLLGRYPQPVPRTEWDFIVLDSQVLEVGVPAQLLANRRDIRAAEREVGASGLDVLVARARFFPRFDITAGVGYEAFNPRYLFDPGAFIANAAGELVAPLINKSAIKADYLNANARQLQAIYDYQRTVLNAYTEVINAITKVENYRRSVQIKQGQVAALEQSVNVATDLFQNARAEYVDVLFSQRDLLEARTDLIETKQQQLAAIVKAYQALGGGYLWSSTGMTWLDVYCEPLLIQPDEVIMPPMPEDALELPSPDDAPPMPPAPAGQPMAPPAVDPMELSQPGDVSLQPAYADPIWANNPGPIVPNPHQPVSYFQPAAYPAPVVIENPLRP